MRLPGKKSSATRRVPRAHQPRTYPTAYIRQRCRRSRDLRAYDRGSAWPFRARCHSGLCTLGYGARRSGRSRLSGDRTNAGRCSGGSMFKKGFQEDAGYAANSRLSEVMACLDPAGQWIHGAPCQWWKAGRSPREFWTRVFVHEVTGNQGLTKGCRHRQKRLDKNIPKQSSGDTFRHHQAAFDCELAWNKEPVFGVIGIQSGPRGLRVHSGFHAPWKPRLGC